MTNDKIATKVTDKNGRQTTVHKNPPVTSSSRLSNTKLQPAPVVADGALRPSGLSYEQIVDDWQQFRSHKHRWTKPERDTRNVLESLFVYIENPDTKLDEDIPPYNKPFRDIRSKANGLHFAKEALSDDERSMLIYIESLLTKIDLDAGEFVY